MQLHRASGRYSAALSMRPRQASEMINCTPVRPRSTRCRRNADQPDLSSLVPSQMPRISRKPSELTALGDVAHLARPAALHHDAIEIEVRVLALDASVP